MTLSQKEALSFLTSHDNILSAAFFEDGTISIISIDKDEPTTTIPATMRAVRDYLRY